MDTLRLAGLSLAFSLCSPSATLPQAGPTQRDAGALSAEGAPEAGPTAAPSPAPTAAPAERRAPRRGLRDAKTRSICVGCGGEPSTTGSIRGDAAEAPHGKRDASSNGLRTAAKPQADLDTLKLASAQRERARSVDEKTSGLWQSWLVSVCDGCGDQKPARPLPMREWPERMAATTADTAGSGRPLRTSGHAAARWTYRRQAGLVSDLSPASVATIRRMPRP